jgi:hypothetical protein
MVPALSILGTVFAAFCIWLTVRIVNRRERWAICAALALVSILIVVIAVNLLYNPQPWIKLDPARLAELRNGMPQADVEKLLGGPPGCYGNPRFSGGEMTLEGYFGPPGSVEKVWFDDRNRFELWFDASDHLVTWHKRASFSRHYRPPSWRLTFRKLTGL